jgi:hypothetical protein
MIVDDFANEKYAAFLIEHRAADADLRRRVTGFSLEQGFDPRMIGGGVGRHDARTQPPERLIAFDIVWVLGEREAGLRGRHQLARPDQPIGISPFGVPVGFVAGFGGQTVGSVIKAASVVVPPGSVPPGPSMSASDNVRHVPEISTSEGRKRAL